MNYAADEIAIAMEPLLPLLGQNIEDLAMQSEGVCFVCREGRWERHEVDVSSEAMWQITKLAGSLVKRDVDERRPLFDTYLPRGERFNVAVPGAVAVGEIAYTIRKPDSKLPLFEDAPSRYNTTGWNKPQFRQADRDMSELLEIFRGGDLWEFMPAAVKARLPILFVGATGSGKTTMSKLAGTAMGEDERIVTIEDAIEMVLRQPNNVRLLYPSDGIGPVTVHKLQDTALRMRPDRILIQEVRQEEVAWIYVRHNGHRGSLATIHGTDACGGARQLLQLFKGSDRGRGYDIKDAIDMIRHAVDVVIPLDRDGKVVSVGATWFSADSAARGETIAELLL